MNEKTKIMFVCLGNICRSPMAEYLFKYKLKKLGREKEFEIKSSATSTWEIGNPVHFGTRRILSNLGINCSEKRSQLLKKDDYDKYDLFIGMEEDNRYDMIDILGGDKENKVHCLLDFSPTKRNISDPYYTGNFESTYNDIEYGLNYLLKYIDENIKAQK